MIFIHETSCDAKQNADTAFETTGKMVVYTSTNWSNVGRLVSQNVEVAFVAF
jgi:hypothetical protein